MAYHNINHNLFDLIVTRDNVLNKKPHSDMADLIFKTFPEFLRSRFRVCFDPPIIIGSLMRALVFATLCF